MSVSNIPSRRSKLSRSAAFFASIALPCALASAQPPATDAPPPPATGTQKEPEGNASGSAGVGSSPQATPPRVPMLDEGFALSAYDGRATLRIGLLASARATLEAAPGQDVSPSASVRLLRTTLGGHVFSPAFQYFVQVEFAGPPRLLDAELRYQPLPEIGVRFGQYRTPTSRQFLAPLWGISFADRSIVSDRFRQGRDIGLEVLGGLFDSTLGYTLGLYNGSGPNAPTRVQGEYLVAGRVQITPWGPFSEVETQMDAPPGLAIGLLANHHSHAANPDTATPAYDETTLGMDVSARVGGLYASAEGYYQLRDEDGSSVRTNAGTFAQASYFVLPRTLELGGRFNFIDEDIDTAGALLGCDAVLSYYVMANHLKLNGQYSFADTDIATGGYLPGTTHRGLIQFVLLL